MFPEQKGSAMDQTGYARQPYKGRKCIYTCNDVSLIGMDALEDPAVLNRLFPGQPVRFHLEPDAPFDSSAVQVLSQFNDKIGYLPKESEIKEMAISWLRQGKPLWAEIDSIDLTSPADRIVLNVAFFSEELDEAEEKAAYRHAPEERQQAAPQPIIINNYYTYTAPAPAPNRPISPRSRWLAFILCFLFGVLGVHRFYVGKVGTGLLWLFTGGMFGFGWLVDLIAILIGGFTDKAGLPLKQ